LEQNLTQVNSISSLSVKEGIK